MTELDINEIEAYNSNKMGWIELITGCMFAGKTEEFIRRLRVLSYAKKRVLAFKPSIDNRYSVENIISHSGSKLDSYLVHSSDEIKQIIEKENQIQQVDVIGIDEVQFFDEQVVELIEQLANQGIIVIVNGLDKDFRCLPFKNVDKLLVTAEFVTKLRARCHLCGNFANRSQRIVNGQPALWDSPLILVDGKESYEARCRNCFIVPKKEV
ncbi:thymidine kinase [Mycoplasma mycoides subsp. mycoides]|uniref:Thymidine kinase n=1 Tax=Mycoplasma mycoides subsp. mycoides TaxID=2103 RepID=A0AAE2EJA4_MYCMY|nr:thymidine kinase [Mycoplasma mycoides]ADK69697.1 thymidine kinase [Mycoplasma mycoides subsp. mycoides SC str. Gladysdale]AIZ54997.1 thymidine kinase [Mycoplasma mycoides subsp. mycoides]AME10357.1 thymidine kinase [Mycoplasma mycoides subsp. mycoides]AME11363.1 thymidine kinase [Mycoplasma mycoides subsp. mycoides]AME12385.1 thymidine kinase [Mycoplasma mycoides subsp. mycoides]